MDELTSPCTNSLRPPTHSKSQVKRDVSDSSLQALIFFAQTMPRSKTLVAERDSDAVDTKSTSLSQHVSVRAYGWHRNSSSAKSWTACLSGHRMARQCELTHSTIAVDIIPEVSLRNAEAGRRAADIRCRWSRLSWVGCGQQVNSCIPLYRTAFYLLLSSSALPDPLFNRVSIHMGLVNIDSNEPLHRSQRCISTESQPSWPLCYGWNPALYPSSVTSISQSCHGGELCCVA